MSLQANLQELFVAHALGWALLVAAAVAAVALVRMGKGSLAALAVVLLLVALVVLDGAWFGAFGAVLMDLWVAMLVLGALALFLTGLWVLGGLSRRHRDDDPGAGTKVAVAAVAGLVLAAGGFLVVFQFHAQAEEGIHTTFVETLNKTLGAGAYLEAQSTIGKRTEAIATQQSRLDEANATIAAYRAANPEAPEDLANATGLPGDVAAAVEAQGTAMSVLEQLRADRTAAEVESRKLAPNYALWRQVEPLALSGQVDEAERLVTLALDPATVTQVVPADAGAQARNEAPCARNTEGHCTEPFTPKAIEYQSLDSHGLRVPVAQAAPDAFHARHEFSDQMTRQLQLFVYPGLIGLLLAPIVFAGGMILDRAYVPSDTVGYRPYPGTAAGLFLLVLGAFSPLVILGLGMAPMLDPFALLSIPFAAWVLRDLRRRSLEGQIAL